MNTSGLGVFDSFNTLADYERDRNPAKRAHFTAFLGLGLPDIAE